MLMTIVVVLIVLWLLGMVTSYTLGGVLHVLLVIAVIVLLIRVIQGRDLSPDGPPPDHRSVLMVRIIGILLIVIGLVALATGGLNYTRREKVVDIGPIEATAEKRDRIPLPPLLGGAALAGGIVLLLAGGRKRPLRLPALVRAPACVRRSDSAPPSLDAANTSSTTFQFTHAVVRARLEQREDQPRQRLVHRDRPASPP